MDKTPAPPLPLPEKFVDFLNDNGLDPSIYTFSDSIPRYIRVKPGCDEASCLEELEAEIRYKPQKVDWLPGFYSLPNQVQIANTRLYKQGHIYGIDAASGAAVSALGISVGDHVLDLCAAPGAKLCLILDILGDSGSATAVDVSPHRLAACRTLVQKYSLGDRCRLFVADGTTFSLGPTKNLKDKSYAVEDNKPDDSVFGEWRSRRPWKERRKQRREIRAAAATIHSSLVVQRPQLIFYGKKSGVIGLTECELYQTLSMSRTGGGYDKVLVDAECTHDGSIRHIQKFEQWGWETLQQRVLNAERTDDNLMLLQLKLLSNGFRLLKVDGRLIYSTCSLTIAQNEDVVQQFLDDTPSAVLEEIEDCWPCRSGRIPKTLRFDPSTSQTSGLFIAKFTKSRTDPD